MSLVEISLFVIAFVLLLLISALVTLTVRFRRLSAKFEEHRKKTDDCMHIPEFKVVRVEYPEAGNVAEFSVLHGSAVIGQFNLPKHLFGMPIET